MDRLLRRIFASVFLTSMVTFTITATASPGRSLRAESEPSISAYLLIDADTGKTLHHHQATLAHPPASLAKMMTLYLLFEALDKHKIHMDSKIVISSHAAKAEPSVLGVRPGDALRVREAIPALIVKSANDVARAVAEFLGKTEENFASMMTERARSLGMQHSQFRNASGLPHPEQKTTAVDMAKLAMALKHHFPHYWPFFKQTSFRYKGRDIHGHNHITKNYSGADGLKTGYTSKSRFNIVSSARRGSAGLIAVVLGGKTAQHRDRKVRELMDPIFAEHGFPSFASADTGYSKKRFTGHRGDIAQGSADRAGKVKLKAKNRNVAKAKSKVKSSNGSAKTTTVKLRKIQKVPGKADVLQATRPILGGAADDHLFAHARTTGRSSSSPSSSPRYKSPLPSPPKSTEMGKESSQPLHRPRGKGDYKGSYYC